MEKKHKLSVFLLPLCLLFFASCDDRMDYIEELTNREPSNKVKAAQALAKYDDPDTVKALLLALNDSDKKLRYASLNSLKEIFERNHGKDPSGIAFVPLSKLLKYDPDIKIRYAAMEVLGVSDNHKVDDVLMGILADPSTPGSLRLGAAGLLGDRKCQKAEGVLIKALLHDPDRDVRRTAAWALGEVGSSDQAMKALESILEESRYPDMQAVVKEALEKVKNAYEASQKGRPE